MNRQQRQLLLIKLEDEGKTNEGHVFLVRNKEKRADKQYWVPVTGAVISMFLNAAHDFRYLGPANSPAVKAKIAEIDKAQEHIVGELASPKDDTFEVSLDLSDLGLEGVKEPDAPKGKVKTGDKKDET